MKLHLLIIFLINSSIASNVYANGEQLYMQNCMVCHGYDGSGTMPGVLDLNENKSWYSAEEEILVGRLKEGIRNPNTGMNMPAKGGNPKLTDTDLKEIIRYMRNSF